MIEGLAPSGRGEFEITDVLNHYIPGGGLFTEVYDGHWADAGTVPSLLRAAELAERDDAAGSLSAPVARPGDAAMTRRGSDPAGRAPARHRRRRVHRLGARAPAPRPATTGRGSPSSTSSPTPATARTSRRSRRTPEQAARFAFVQGDIADPDVVGAARRRGRRGRQRRRRDPRRPLDPRPGGVPADRRHRRPRAARGGPARDGAGAAGERRSAPRFLQVSTDEVYGDIAEGRSRRDRRPRPAQPVRRREGRRRAARPRLPRDLRARHGRSPAARTPTARTSTPRS